MLTVVPMIVCGREKRHSAPSGRTAGRATARPVIGAGAATGSAPTGTNTRPASEPSTKRPAKMSAAQPVHRLLDVLDRLGQRAAATRPPRGLRPLTATA